MFVQIDCGQIVDFVMYEVATYLESNCETKTYSLEGSQIFDTICYVLCLDNYRIFQICMRHRGSKMGLTRRTGLYNPLFFID